MSESPEDCRPQARGLAERALQAQARGDDATADRLFAEAQLIDPDAVAEVLAEHDAAHEPDARDPRTAARDRAVQQPASPAAPH
jgi:hypothetical protein